MAIDKAIAEAANERPVQMAAIKVTIGSSGRLIGLTVPVDFGGQEALDLIGYIAAMLPAELAKLRGQQSPIVIPRGISLPRT